jgi:hypothetical protein
MQTHRILDNAEAGLDRIGGEFLADSGFENEEPDTTDFLIISAIPRED